ncbi:MAG: DNA translocase FtsK [Clostridia bacterium]|nr:DNA translocase FtsK [Clostridia bacterium]
MLAGFDTVGTLIIVIAALIIFSIFLFGATPRSIFVSIAYRIKRHREEKEAVLAEQRSKAVYPDDPYIPVTAETKKQLRPARKIKRHQFDPDVSLEEEDEEENISTSPIDDNVRIDPYVEEEVDSILDEAAYAAAKSKREDPLVLEMEAEEETAAAPELPVTEQLAPEELSDDAELDWKNIFIDPDPVTPDLSLDVPLPSDDDAPESAETELSVTRTRPEEPKEVVKKTAPPPKPAYIFPPLDLLRMEEAPPETDENELKSNAKRLVDTLLSFNVKTKVINVSKGPTITRYELQPEAGTRVRSIANLVDDIALSLATSGVRIEAPIPGKSAVGIEVPNRTTAMVCLRSLLENKQFETAPSKITAALGKDVVGNPMYMDIAKMPHLLIAGATGSGKSVCINSIIISLLYKARPDEMKLILIDPKKVELNVYNGLPHLLVPVVSDPKKAAGSLSWAVTEMERRFELIEEVGAREIKGYNSITAKDPEKEFLPQIVIVIDELADLMMTASDDVETSICRLAQKARAAGMHLIVGTQRPSVDVITGLIKANIPSRIAFTTSNQADSRTIIDMGGAEKLIGRGDMLYSPIGANKPMRGQGSFVSDEEVETVVEFIKKNTDIAAQYSDEVIQSIERAAELCGVKKKDLISSTVGDGDEEGGDPMLKAALELAVDSGKISTSLIQRKLSLGYGRAAKLIDRMEELGYVSAPEGQKPREVLLTKQEYMEMVLKDADIE